MREKTHVLHRDYLKATKIVEEYLSQFRQPCANIDDLSIDLKVKRNYPESWDYWVTEIQGRDVLLRTTEKLDDPKYDDFLVNISEIRPLDEK